MRHTPTLSGESRLRSTAGALHAGTLSSTSLRHESDERLVALTRGGSERAFAEITRRYQRQLQWYCSRLVGPERAQDAVQQALLQAFLSLRDRAPREIALRPWLYRIAHNCSIDLLRMGSWEYEQLDLESDGVPQPPALVEQKEELQGLIARMRRLPEAQRRALTLRELEGCSYEEISARLGHSGSGVRQLIFRARSALRKGAATLLPFGMLRERLAGMAPAVEGHHVAGVAAVPASSGNGVEALGAAALAVVALVGGVAGGVRAGHSGHSHRALGDEAHTEPPLESAVRVPIAVRTAPDRAPRSGTPAAKREADAPSAPAVEPLEQATAPVAPMPAPPAPAASPVEVTPEPAAEPVTQPAEQTTTVEQQTLIDPAREEDDSTGGSGDPSSGGQETDPASPEADAPSEPADQPQAGASRRTAKRR